MVLTEVSVEQAAAELCGPDAPRLIDVREADEWELVRVQAAELVPLSQWPAAATEKLTRRDERLLVLCHHGGRSTRAVSFLLENGYTNAVNVSGGIDAWAVHVDQTLARY